MQTKEGRKMVKNDEAEWAEYERVGREMRLEAGGDVTLKEKIMRIVKEELEHLARVRRMKDQLPDNEKSKSVDTPV